MEEILTTESQYKFSTSMALDNVESLTYFLETYCEYLQVIQRSGTYAEIQLTPELMVELHSGGDGDFNSHVITIIQVPMIETITAIITMKPLDEGTSPIIRKNGVYSVALDDCNYDLVTSIGLYVTSENFTGHYGKYLHRESMTISDYPMEEEIRNHPIILTTDSTVLESVMSSSYRMPTIGYSNLNTIAQALNSGLHTITVTLTVVPVAYNPHTREVWVKEELLPREDCKTVVTTITNSDHTAIITGL